MVWTISGHRMVGWRRFASATVYNSVCCLEKALEWTKMSSTTGNRTCPTLFKVMTQGIFGTWMKLDFSKKVCQTITWESLIVIFLCSATGEKFKPLVLANHRCHELSTNSCLVESSGNQTPKHGWQEQYFWNIVKNSTPKCRLRTERPLFFLTTFLVIQKWSFPTSSLFSFHQTWQQGPSLWTLESYKTLRLNIARCFLNFFYPMKTWLL